MSASDQASAVALPKRAPVNRQNRTSARKSGRSVGQELDLIYAEKTLQYVYTLWGRPVHLETLYEGKKILLSYDGERNTKSSLEK